MPVRGETVDDERAGVAGGDEVENQGEDGEPAEEAAWKERNDKITGKGDGAWYRYLCSSSSCRTTSPPWPGSSAW